MYCLTFGECLLSTQIIYEAVFCIDLLIKFFVDVDDEYYSKFELYHKNCHFVYTAKRYLFGRFIILAIPCYLMSVFSMMLLISYLLTVIQQILVVFCL